MSATVKTDALSDLIRTVGDDSSAERKAIYHLWSALDDITRCPPETAPAYIAERGLTLAARALYGGR